MSELVGSVPARQAAAEAGSGVVKKPRGRLALELVAMRGKDVVGVRHLHEGGSAWVGHVNDTMVRLSMREFGGQPLVVGEARSGTYAVLVPPRARARVHGSDGIPRLLVGPQRVELQEGERTVVVLGPVQIRAQVVPFDAPAPRFGTAAIAAAWVAVLGVVYAAAMAVTTVLSHASPPAPPLPGEHLAPSATPLP